MWDILHLTFIMLDNIPIEYILSKLSFLLVLAEFSYVTKQVQVKTKSNPMLTKIEEIKSTQFNVFH